MKNSPLFSASAILSCKKALSIDEKAAFSEICFSDLIEELELFGEKATASKYLTDAEKESFYGFKYEKRRVEWLAGRVAVKKALLSLDGAKNKEWQKWQVEVGRSGRPFIASGNNSPEVSISHSGGMAVAMALSKSMCGIDVQEVTEKVAKVEKKFATEKEVKLFDKNCKKSGLSRKQFLTLLWSAKESLRKGIELVPVPGFLELKLCGILEEISEGVVFDFTFQRYFEKTQNNDLIKTFQILGDKHAFAVFIKK